MNKPNCLLIAGSTTDYAELENTGLLDALKQAFSADCALSMTNLKDLDTHSKTCGEILAILYLNSFESSYQEILSWSRNFNNIQHVYKASFDKGRVWVYNKDLVIACVELSDVPKAIKEDIGMNTWFREKASPFAVFVGIILLALVYFQYVAQDTIQAEAPIKEAIASTDYVE